MKKILSILVVAILAASLGVAAAGPAGATAVGNTQGCTPGYWKNHPQSWLERPTDTAPVYTPSTPLSTISNAFNSYLPGATFGSALQGGGGTGLTGAAKILARAATASWLNATVEIAFPYRRFQPGYGGVQSINTLVTNALLSGDRQTIIDLAATLDQANNLGCPLS